jgi:hypothetical protein
MKTFEIWDQSSTTALGKPTHILQADKIEYTDGVYLFKDETMEILHAIVATPGMLVRTPKNG